MAQRIKYNLYGFLFRFFSFFADKTGGNVLFVKPKVALGSLVLGLSAGACSTVQMEPQIISKKDIKALLKDENFAQSDTNANRENFFCYVTQLMPQFPGGEVALMKFIQDNLKTPPVITCYQGVQGRVVLKFVVNEDGSLSDIQVVRSLDPACDKEAVRIVELMPKWIPGKQGERVCKVWYNLAIRF
jgi:TonB family protein